MDTNIRENISAAPVAAKHETRTQRKYIPAAVLTVLPCLSIAAYLILRGRRPFAQAVSDRFSSPVRAALGRASAVIPFSVTELLYAAAVIGLIVFIVLSVIKIVRSKGRRLTSTLKRAGALLLAAAYIFSGYCWLWGIDYRTASFSEESGLASDGVTGEELAAVAAYFAYEASRLAGRVERADDMTVKADVGAYFDVSVHIYDRAQEIFPCIDGVSYRPKAMVFSRLMSRLGFTGIYFPFTGESNINIDQPDSMIPFTVAHELAHQRGVYAEQEANFLGIISCITSGDIDYAYSGCLGALIYLMNALYTADPDAWREIRVTFGPELEHDWLENNAYWRAFESPVADAAESVYDGYLRSNGQELGVRSYGACVDLLVEYCINGTE